MADDSRSDAIRRYFPTVYTFNPFYETEGVTLVQDQSGRVLTQQEVDELILAITRGYEETPPGVIKAHNARVSRKDAGR